MPPPGSRPGAAASLEAGVRHASLETRIGAQLLNRVGILAVLIGVAWFLKLAFDRNWIGPPIRILVGLACAAGLVAWSERFRRRGFAAFSYSLKALGTGIAYLSLWAAFSVFHLASAGLIFSAMTAVTVANAVLAWRQDSELLALYALAGGFRHAGAAIGGSRQRDLSFFLSRPAQRGCAAAAGVAPMETAGVGRFAGHGGLLLRLDGKPVLRDSHPCHPVFSGGLLRCFRRHAFPHPAPSQCRPRRPTRSSRSRFRS